MTNYFIDHDAKEGQLSGTLTFTNGSDQVTGSGTQFTTELQVGDYIISDDPTYGKEWYKVVEIIDDVTLRIDHAFYQDTHSSTASYNKQSNVTNGGTSASYDSGTGVGPFCHIQQFFDIAQAGDIGYVRRGKTYYSSQQLEPVNDGTAGSYIVLMGDDGTGWPDESGLAKPIIDLTGATYARIYFYADLYYYLKDIKIFHGQIFNSRSPSNRFEKIDIDVDTLSYSGLYIAYSTAHIEDCKSNGRGSTDGGLKIDHAFVIVKDSEFWNVYSGDTPAIHIEYLALGYIWNCKTGTSHAGTRDIQVRYGRDGNSLRFKGYKFATTEHVFLVSPIGEVNILFEDYDGTVGAHKIYRTTATIERDTSEYTGNASDSVKIIPTSYAPQMPQYPVFEWKITNVSAAEHTVTVYVKGSGWTTLPTADELYIEVEYYDESTGTHTATAKSSEVLDANDTWKAFTVTFTPAQDGDIYVRGYLKKYEDGAVVWFNGEVEIT